MRSAIATVCVSGTLDEKLAAIAAAGFDGIELFETDLITSRLSPEQVAARCADLGLTIDLYQPFRDFEGVEPSVLAANLRRAESKFDLMHRLGVDRILVCSNVGTATIPYDEAAVDQLGLLAELAARHEVQVAYEALAWGRYVSTYDHSWRIVEQVDHPSLGVCLDSFHILSRSTDLSVIAEIPGDKISFCQLADAPRMSLDVLSWSRHYRLFPGEGSWDLADFVSRVVDAGYTGPLSLEVFNDVFRESDPRATAVDARRSLVALEDAVSLRRREVPAAEPAGASSNTVAQLPAAIDPTGFSFIELRPALDEEVEPVLTSLGFGLVGRHRRKNVHLWALGDARLIVNRELAADEVSIAALGIEVTDVDAAATRATALYNSILDRDREGDEDVLLAVRAPDDTELYFSQGENWSAEFGVLPTSSATGITHIDHVALVQPWDRVEEAVLFYRSLLGLEATEFVDVPGSTGLVRSRSLVSTPGRVGDHPLRIALNALPAHASANDDYPNHIAFHTDDLLGTLRSLGDVPILEVPDNYYDDLDARYDLGAERLDELRRHNVLVDRTTDGEFLHAYTRPVGRLFFELVERRGGYDGYGAGNAPVRLAAQRELRSRQFTAEREPATT
jgi:4-hydroxyphenylpyruvate dioxygenase